ncbi:hypothetical protein N9216_01660 [Pseudomonadales bacterium]|nr:hypothetical protein [Pseudomonadales bacterium]
MGLITETNEQYYAGSQKFIVPGDAPNQQFTTTFNTELVFGSSNPSTIEYAINNFKLYKADIGSLTYTEYVLPYTVSGNTITIAEDLDQGVGLIVQLKTESGGNYGNKDAYGETVQDNWGSYAYTKLNDVINNFIVAYVGAGKLIPSVKRTDVIFHAKRAMQEFSYDTLKSINSQELNIPNSLSVAIPQDYVNYVNIHWVDKQGVKHIIMPTQLTSNPYSNPIQDQSGIPMQDNFGDNIEGTSITEERWANNDLKERNEIRDNSLGFGSFYGEDGYGAGQLYGLDPQYANVNGYFTINEREGKFSFSSDLVGKLIILEYVSDGLSTNLNTRVPKMAEEAMYAYISHAIIASRINQPEYVVNRLKREKSAKLRNTKIRLSNIKLNEIVQVLRGQSKWIKH